MKIEDRNENERKPWLDLETPSFDEDEKETEPEVTDAFENEEPDDDDFDSDLELEEDEYSDLPKQEFEKTETPSWEEDSTEEPDEDETEWDDPDWEETDDGDSAQEHFSNIGTAGKALLLALGGLFAFIGRAILKLSRRVGKVTVGRSKRLYRGLSDKPESLKNAMARRGSRDEDDAEEDYGEEGTRSTLFGGKFNKRFIIVNMALVAVLLCFVIVLLTTPKSDSSGQSSFDAGSMMLFSMPTYSPEEIQLLSRGNSAETEATPQDEDVTTVAETTSEAIFSQETPEPVPTPAPTQAAKASEDYLPIVKRAKTEEKLVAITIDDCFQQSNLQRIIDWTYSGGGKLTLFPIGQNLLKEGMAPILQDAVYNKGFEIENHTFNHKKLYRLSAEDMCREVYLQMAAVSYVLQCNYHQHFFRFMGGDGERDQRSNVYLKQLGFKGIAHWSYSGSDASLEESKQKLAPGMIYLFHTTDRDTEILKEFIPYCVSQGYRLVTLNELYGLPENEQGDFSEYSQTIPSLQSFEWDYREIGEGDASYRTKCMQESLSQKGYLDDRYRTEDGEWSGYYGEHTVAAVRRFQEDHGLNASSVADERTQRALLG